MPDLLSTEVFAVDLLTPEYVSELDFARGPFPFEFFDPVPEVVPPPPPPTDPPVVSGFSPALATAISKSQTLSFTVLPVGAALLGRVLILVSFPGLGLYETAHDGAALGPAYPAALGNVRTPNGNGFDYTLLRKEGWPSSPRIVPVAVDQYGNINLIDSVIYAWTLTGD